MGINLFKESIRRLGESLDLPEPLVINDSMSVSLVLNKERPLIINLIYQPDTKQIRVESPLSFRLPMDIQDVQEMMIELMPDLIKRDRSLGSLVATVESNQIDLVKRIDLSPNQLDILVKYLPLFIEEALSWREKVKRVLNPQSLGSCFKEEEILDFSTQIS